MRRVPDLQRRHTQKWTANGRHLERDGEPTFLLADKLWAAFARPAVDEWTAYVRQRRRQGFNAVNISILPITHDASESNSNSEPFDRAATGLLDVGRLRCNYFDRARTVCEIAVAEGITPVLAVLWCNYVPETWGARRTQHLAMTEQQSERYVDLVLETFSDLGPIYVVSGDERFDQESVVERYANVLQHVKAAAPHCITTMHSTPDADLPKAIAAMPELDFYSYQSGHDTGWLECTHTLADEYLRQQPVDRPVIDIEPCYEGHGYGVGTGRHGAAAVRAVSWTAVLAGTSAGLGYAAHGAWSWHRHGGAFGGEHSSGTPFPVDVALGLEGALDVGLLRHIVETHGLFEVAPAQSLVVDNRSNVRVGRTESTVALYMPHFFRVVLNDGTPTGRVTCWDLVRRRPDIARIRHDGHTTVIEQPEFLGDALVLLTDE